MTVNLENTEILTKLSNQRIAVNDESRDTTGWENTQNDTIM